MTFDKSKIYLALLTLAVTIAVVITRAKLTPEDKLLPPMDNFSQRPKLLKFGMYVSPNPEQNPIDPPERFTGYHTALDIEIMPDELDKEVFVFASCSGPVVLSEESNGYGGVLVQSCTYNNESITVLYGHLKFDSIDKNKSFYHAGEKIGLLGAHKSNETSFTRKHLHFAIHRGNKIELRGYVQSEEELSQYINPETAILN